MRIKSSVGKHRAKQLKCRFRLALARELCDRHGALLIFDEVVTFGRHDGGTAQVHYGITPDLTALGKCLANGLPLAAVVGRADIMRELDRGVFFSTTFGGDVLALSVAKYVLTALREQSVSERLRLMGLELADRLRLSADGARLEVVGYPQRLLWRWNDPAAQEAFGVALLRRGVLSQGYINLMLAHEQVRTELLRAFTEAAALTASGPPTPSLT